MSGDVLSQAEVESLLSAMDRREADVIADAATSRYLPAMARTPWTAVLDNSGNVLGYLPFDAFF